MRNSWRLILIGCGIWSTQVSADQYHYHNLIVGERAMGLGGAFSAVADDASGVIYNPAGLGFALSSDISGSANAIYSKKTVYKKTIANDDFTEESSQFFVFVVFDGVNQTLNFPAFFKKV